MWPMTKHITTHIYVYTVSYTYINTCILYKYIKSIVLCLMCQLRMSLGSERVVEIFDMRRRLLEPRPRWVPPLQNLRSSRTSSDVLS